MLVTGAGVSDILRHNDILGLYEFSSENLLGTVRPDKVNFRENSSNFALSAIELI